VAPSQEPGDRNALPSRALYPSSHYPQPSIEIAPINSVPEISLCPGHQQVSEGCREPTYHTTALRSRPGASCSWQSLRNVSKDVWEPRGSGSRTPIAMVGGTLEKSEAVGTTGEIGVEMIRQCSKTRRSRSVLKCRRYTRCREPRADAIPWQKRLPQRSEYAGTGRRI